jgi:cell wall-associated NlpC family hydrolase
LELKAVAPFDPRLVLVRNGEVASRTLEGVVEARAFLQPEPMQLALPMTALRRKPSRTGEQLDQLLFGERFDVLERREGWCFGQALRDGYVGWVRLEGLAPAAEPPTHWVSALRTYVYAEPSIKAAPVGRLSLNALVREAGRDGSFVRLEESGYVAERHLRPLGTWAEDPAEVAERFLHTPYLWGGRDSVGLDCSGLVQQALYACGIAAPRDSDQQARLGRDVASAELARGDLVFWRGHVGLMLDHSTLLHANAFHMAVARETLAETIGRIGEPVAYRRVRP